MKTKTKIYKYLFGEKNKEEYSDMKVSEQEMFDALTSYYKNDWKTGKWRTKGIQVGNSKWYLIPDVNGNRSNLIVYKHDDDYDITDLCLDFRRSMGRGTHWSINWNFPIKSINRVAKRKEFSDEGWIRLMNNYAERYEEIA